MKKVVLATLLAVASTAMMPYSAQAQTAVNPQSGASGGGITLPPAESTAYNTAIATTDPKAKAALLETFLTTYPSSQVKVYVLQQLMQAYYQAQDVPHTLDAADRLLQVDANNLTALTLEASLRKMQADAVTDPTQKQAGLDVAAGFAQRGLDAPRPKDPSVSDDDFAKQKAAVTYILDGTIAADAMGKKDSATAIKIYKAELESVPVDQTKAPGALLQDTYNLGLVYYQSTPPDYLNCAWYTTRAADFAPEPYKSQMAKVATYCYKQYHGANDGYDAVVAATQANLEPPASFTVTPAKTPAEMVADLMATTPDPTVLAIDDRETVLQFGKPEDVAKMWDAIKDKAYTIPGALVIASTPTQLQVALSTPAVQSKTADFTFNLKPIEPPAEPSAKATPAQRVAYKRAVTEAQKTADDIAAATAVGSTVTLTGTYASYTTKPMMITMSDGAVVLPEKPAAHRPAAHK